MSAVDPSIRIYRAFLLPKMPFQSTAQQRFAFGTGQPWAKRWADETDFSKLPKRVKRVRSRRLKGCTCGTTTKGEQIAPGVTRIRGNLCNVHGKYGPCDAGASGKKPKKGRAGAKPKAPKKDPVKTRAQTLGGLGYSAADQQALTALRSGQQPGEVSQQLLDQGLVERASDGSYRMTASGRALLGAADQGDAGRARDTVSAAGDRTRARAGRQAAAQQRRQDTAGKRAAAQMDRELRQRERDAKRAAAAAAKKPSGGGKKKPEAQAAPPSKRAARLAPRGGGPTGATGAPSSSSAPKPKPKPAEAKPEKVEPTVAPALQEAATALSEGADVSEAQLDALIRNGLVKLNKDGAPVLTAAGQRITKKEITLRVFKDASGVDRWLTTSSTAYRDRDREIVSTKALSGAVALADASGYRGPLRFWHVPGVDLGQCDYQATAQDGRFLIESGTFRSPEIAAAVKAHADEYRVSIGFTHPADEPDRQGVFHHIAIFERSLVPAGRASNPFTHVAVKEQRMLTTEKQTALRELLGGDETLLQGLLSQVAQTDKTAQDSGVAYKDDAPPAWATALIGRIEALETSFKSTQPETTEKAAPPMEDEAKADVPMELVDEAEAVGDENMLNDTEISAIAQQTAQVLLEALMPHLGIGQKMDEVKSLLGGMAGSYAQKDAAIAEIKGELETVKAQVDDLSGSQPRILAGGYRASQSKTTITTDETKLKDAQPAADPVGNAFGAFLADLGLSGPVAGA